MPGKVAGVGCLVTSFSLVALLVPSWPSSPPHARGGGSNFSSAEVKEADATPEAAEAGQVALGERPNLGYKSVECWSAGDFLFSFEIEKVYKNVFQREHLLVGLSYGKKIREGRKKRRHFLYCVQHKSVHFVPPVDVAKPPPVPPLCGLPALVSLLKKGGDAAEWVGDGPPAFRFKPHGYGDCAALLEAGSLDRRTLFSVLKGERIVFSGDSMVRQMYLRLIEMIRNDRPEKEDEFEYIEHYYHQDSYYAASAEKDVLLMQWGLPDNSTVDQYFPNRSDIQFELVFVWDARPDTFSRVPFQALPTTIIAGYFYWWKGDSPASQIDPYITALSGFLQANPGTHYYNVPAPWVEGRAHFGIISNEVRTARNKYVSEKLAGLSNAHVLDFASFADIRHFEKTEDLLHYACIYKMRFPAAIRLKESKIKPGGCHDPINRNWAVILLSAVAASRHSEAHP